MNSMKKSASFAARDYKGWPRPEEIEHYFLAPTTALVFETETDDAQGVDGTENLPPNAGGRAKP